jgi:alkanesulfonate monooxygenase SsuD/methylene tetrahydromethanopterin reductase-like flavin-dependent oxidoreductase (luciferase family)
MDLGIFIVPYRPSSVPQSVGLDYDMQVVKWAEEYGFSEAWFAEHYTVAYEAGPAPDIMIAAASQHTTTLRLGAAAHLLPYHNPMALAHRIMLLDHMTKGRYMCGVAGGGFPTDKALFGTDDNVGMLDEGLDLLLQIWKADGPFNFRGKHWKFDFPEFDEFFGGPFLRCYQDPHPPIAMPGVQPRSPSLRKAGANGYIPISEPIHVSGQIEQWAVYSEAAEAAGRTPDRSLWRVCNGGVTFVAETDKEAMALALQSGQARAFDDWVIPLFKKYNWVELLAPGLSASELTAEYLIRKQSFIGSPETVAEQLEEYWAKIGGFGTLIQFSCDDIANPEPARRSMELLGKEVLPRLRHLQSLAPS